MTKSCGVIKEQRQKLNGSGSEYQYFCSHCGIKVVKYSKYCNGCNYKLIWEK